MLNFLNAFLTPGPNAKTALHGRAEKFYQLIEIICCARMGLRLYEYHHQAVYMLVIASASFNLVNNMYF